MRPGVLAAIVMLSCGGLSCGGTMAAADGGDAPTGTTGACDPAAQTGCSTNEKCDLFCNGGSAGFFCRPDDGTAAPGAACSVSSAAATAMRCQKGTACLGSTSGLTCVSFCSAASSCGDGGTCMSASITFTCGLAGASKVEASICR